MSHELCIGPNSASNGVSRALLHFDFNLLPARFVATSASLSLNARRGAASTSLSVYRLTAGSWAEGNGTSIADGHLTGACSTWAGLGACGWTGTGSFNGASFAVTGNIGAPTATSSVAVPGVVTFTGMAADVRALASGSNLGWTILSSNEASGSPVVFWSTNTAMGDAAKPALTVSYGRGPGASGCTTPAVDQCHSKGKCNPSDGTCSSPPKANGTACDDGDPCTSKDICENGVCGGLIVAGCVPPMPGPSTALRTHAQPSVLNAGGGADAANTAQEADGVGTTHQELGVSSTSRAALFAGATADPVSVDGGVAKRADAALDDRRSATKQTPGKEPEGCSCRAPASRKTEPRGALVIAALALLAARRRRRI